MGNTDTVLPFPNVDDRKGWLSLLRLANTAGFAIAVGCGAYWLGVSEPLACGVAAFYAVVTMIAVRSLTDKMAFSMFVAIALGYLAAGLAMVFEVAPGREIWIGIATGLLVMIIDAIDQRNGEVW